MTEDKFDEIKVKVEKLSPDYSQMLKEPFISKAMLSN